MIDAVVSNTTTATRIGLELMVVSKVSHACNIFCQSELPIEPEESSTRTMSFSSALAAAMDLMRRKRTSL